MAQGQAVVLLKAAVQDMAVVVLLKAVAQEQIVAALQHKAVQVELKKQRILDRQYYEQVTKNRTDSYCRFGDRYRCVDDLDYAPIHQ